MKYSLFFPMIYKTVPSPHVLQTQAARQIWHKFADPYSRSWNYHFKRDIP